MKFRRGLVSNSSSSSFCLYGFTTTPDGFFELAKKTEQGLKYLKEYHLRHYPLEDFDELFKSQPGLVIECFDLKSDEDDDVYFGNSWTTVKDDETGRQFKNRTKSTVEQLLGKAAANSCATYEISYYN